MAVPVQEYYPDCPEALVVGFARDGHPGAFEELVRRRQSWLRNLMRRLCGDAELADDLAQQVFLKMWIAVRSLREAKAFGGWLRRLAVNTWIAYARKHDALSVADEVGTDAGGTHTGAERVDLDEALRKLGNDERLCVVLAYREGMTHSEIAEATGFPLGTVKSHINQGATRLRELLAAYHPDEPGDS